MYDPDKLIKQGLTLEQQFARYLNQWPTLHWGLKGIADDGWFWFKPLEDKMAAEIKYVVYWGA